MFTKYAAAISFAVLAALGSTVWAAQQTSGTSEDAQTAGKVSAESGGQAGIGSQQPGGGNASSARTARQGVGSHPPGGNLASAMANFMVRTGLVVGPDARGRLVVEHIRPESDAARLGIEPGDVLTSVNGTETNTMRALQDYLSAHASQSGFSIGIERGNNNFTQAMGRQMSLMGMTIFSDSADRPTVYSVQPGSPAAKAGVKTGDVITAVGHQTTDTMSKFMNMSVPLVRALDPGKGVPFRFARDGEPIKLAIARPKDSDLQPLTPAEEHVWDRQKGVLTTATQVPVVPMPAVIRPPGDLTSVVAVLYGPAQNSTHAGASRGTVGFVMIQLTVPPLPAGATALPETNTSVQQTGSFVNPSNPSTVPVLGPPRMGPRAHAKNVTVAVSAQLSGLPEGQYNLVVGQYGDCADLAAIAAQQVAVSLGTIQVHADGRGSLQNASIASAPRDFLNHVVAVVVPAAPGTGNLAAAQATVTTGNTISTGIWGCGIFHMANPRYPLSGELPVAPASRAVPPSAIPATSAPVVPPPRPAPVQP
jgi:hypothetical protein